MLSFDEQAFFIRRQQQIAKLRVFPYVLAHSGYGV